MSPKSTHCLSQASTRRLSLTRHYCLVSPKSSFTQVLVLSSVSSRPTSSRSRSRSYSSFPASSRPRPSDLEQFSLMSLSLEPLVVSISFIFESPLLAPTSLSISVETGTSTRTYLQHSSPCLASVLLPGFQSVSIWNPHCLCCQLPLFSTPSLDSHPIVLPSNPPCHIFPSV